MVSTTLPLTLLGLNTNPDVVRSLLSQTTFPRDRPSYWTRYPNIGADLDVRTSIAFAKKSVMHALTIAQSDSTSAATLSELARFSQKTVRRIVAAQPQLDAETVQYLTAWAVKFADRETLEALARVHDPRIWAPVYMEKSGNQGCSLSHEMAFFMAKCEDEQSVKDLFEVVPTFEWQPPQQSAQVSQALVDFIKSWFAGDTRSQVDIVPLIKDIADVSVRVHTAIHGISRSNYTSAKEKVLTDEYTSLIVEGLDSLTDRQALESLVRLAFAVGSRRVPQSSARILLDAHHPVADQLLFSGVHFAHEEWDADTFNEAVRRVPTRFVHQYAQRTPAVGFLESLTDETFSMLVNEAEPTSWMAVSEDSWVQRLAALPPQDSLRLFFLLPSRCTSQFLLTKDPSFTPEMLHEQLFKEYTVVNYGNPGTPIVGFPLNRDYTFSMLDRSASDLPRTALHALFANLSIGEPFVGDASWKPTAWVLRLLDLAGTVTGERAVNRGEDPTRIDLWTYAVHFHLDALLHDVADAWLPALSLLDGWSGTITELAYASAEMIGHQLSTETLEAPVEESVQASLF